MTKLKADDAAPSKVRIALGDVVKLKAGGDEMEVTALHPGLVTTQWGEGLSRMQASFPADDVVVVRAAKAAEA
ncbi:YodC family protein [Chenggangzhangella methanolivorans]|uniref:YodC family protein n=1 Tax=Chenggangzhangella methanolivorans TaxID=1437009 RepID=A0A9E6RAH2_9HYPH|nr:YodC family protein [Chenggangzhangella methanolivorans]QZN99783.1 YodC family protein [Chenggangzhangella methanolivorans]